MSCDSPWFEVGFMVVAWRKKWFVFGFRWLVGVSVSVNVSVSVSVSIYMYFFECIQVSSL